MSGTRSLWARFNVEKQEFLVKLSILSIAAILGKSFGYKIDAIDSTCHIKMNFPFCSIFGAFILRAKI